MNKIKKVGTAIKLAVGFAVACIVLTCTPAQAQLGSPNTVFATENYTGTNTANLITNKLVGYNVTSTPHVWIDCTKGKELTLEFRFQYLTTSIPATNCTLTFSSSVGKDVNGVGATNVYGSYFTWQFPGSTTDTAFKTVVTNITVGGIPWLKLDSLLPLAPLTNATLKVYVK